MACEVGQTDINTSASLNGGPAGKTGLRVLAGQQPSEKGSWHVQVQALQASATASSSEATAGPLARREALLAQTAYNTVRPWC